MKVLRTKNRTYTLVLLSFFTVSFVGLSLYSGYLRIMNPNEFTKEDASCDIHLENGCYTCSKTSELCLLATNFIEDNQYGIDYYKEGISTVKLNSNYAFIKEGTSESDSTIILYNINEDMKMATFNGVKDYGVGIKEDYIIVILNNKYAIYKLGESISRITSFDYDFIGLANHLDGTVLDNSHFIALKESNWYLLDNYGNILTSSFTNPIVNYTDSTIITKDTYYHLYNYQGIELNFNSYKKVIVTDDYLALVDLNNNLTVYDTVSNTTISNSYIVSDTDEIILENNTTLDLIINNELKESISL